MRTVEIKISDKSIQPPTGSSFDLFVSSCTPLYKDAGIYMIETGIELCLPESLVIRVVGASDYWCLDSIVENGIPIRLAVMVQREPRIGDVVAKATIIENAWALVRFVERSPEGGRIIRGDATEIENRGETRDTES